MASPITHQRDRWSISNSMAMAHAPWGQFGVSFGRAQVCLATPHSLSASAWRWLGAHGGVAVASWPRRDGRRARGTKDQGQGDEVADSTAMSTAKTD